MAGIDFNTADLISLRARLAQLSDPRARRGVRHDFSTILVFIACATLAGHRSIAAIAEWAGDAPQVVLERLGARVSPTTGKRVPPSYSTIGRTLAAVDADELDCLVGDWAATQTDKRAQARPQPLDAGDTPDDDSDAAPPSIGADLVGVAVDGKVLRGARRDDRTQVHLLAALRHDPGTVIGQCNVENTKTNEILAFGPLIKGLDLTGKVITADALHTQRAAARLVCGTKGGHYIFGVKANQPTLHTAGINTAHNVDLDSAEAETTSRGHGRIDRHRVWTAPVPASVQFPHAARFVIIERESSTLTDQRRSIETRIYVTDLTETQADATNLLRLINGHWSIENRLHWVRDVTFDEDRSQVRTGTTPRVLATLRNLGVRGVWRTVWL